MTLIKVWLLVHSIQYGVVPLGVYSTKENCQIALKASKLWALTCTEHLMESPEIKPDSSDSLK